MEKILRKLVWLIILLPAVYLALVWNTLPDTVALHFDIHGTPDRYGNKNELIIPVVILIALNLFVYFILTNIHRIDPKRNAAINKERMWKIAYAVLIFFTAINALIIYTTTHPQTNLGIGLILSATGLLLAIIGNYMPNLQPNYFIGMRLPWTLENPENWRKTHAFAGRLLFAGGIIASATCLFLPTIAAVIVFFTIIFITIVIPCVYSYRLYKSSTTTKLNASGHE